MATNFNNAGSIDAYYEGQKAPVNAQIQNAEAAYKAAVERLQTQKAAQDADAYASFERQKRDLPALLAASGAQGGMVDSAAASMENEYQNGRNNRALQLQADLSDSGRDYDSGVVNLRAQLAQYEKQAAADRAELAYQQAQEAAKKRAAASKTYKEKDEEAAAIPFAGTANTGKRVNMTGQAYGINSTTGLTRMDR